MEWSRKCPAGAAADPDGTEGLSTAPQQCSDCTVPVREQGHDPPLGDVQNYDVCVHATNCCHDTFPGARRDEVGAVATNLQYFDSLERAGLEWSRKCRAGIFPGAFDF